MLQQFETENAEINNDGHSKTAKGIFNMLFASRVEKRFGFTTPFEHQQYLAGVDKNYHVYLPIEFKVDQSNGKVNLKMRMSQKSLQSSHSQDLQVVHKSTTPFVIQRNILNFQPLHHNTNRQIMLSNPRREVSKRNFLAGLVSVAMEFDKAAKNTANKNVMQLIMPSNDNDIHHKKTDVFVNNNAAKNWINMQIVHAESSNDNKSTQQTDSQASPNLVVTDKQPDSEARRKQFLSYLSNSVTHSTNNVWDINVEYPTLYRQNRQVFTVAVGRSHDMKYRSIFYWNTQSAKDANVENELLATGNLRLSHKTPLNYEFMMNHEQQNNFELNVQYGKTQANKKNMNIQGNAMQSNDLKDLIKSSETVKQCQEDVEQGNIGTQACQRAIELASMKDRVKLSMYVEPENQPQIMETIIRILISIFNVNLQTIHQRPTGKNTIDMEIKMLPDQDQTDIFISSSNMELSYSVPSGASSDKQLSLQYIAPHVLLGMPQQVAQQLSSQSSSVSLWQLALKFLQQFLPQLSHGLPLQSVSELFSQLSLGSLQNQIEALQKATDGE